MNTSASHAPFPKLLGDIGGTNVRLAMQHAPDGEVADIRNYPLADFEGPAEAIRYYLRDVGLGEPPLQPRSASLGMACPVLGDQIQMVNAPWAFSTEALRQALGLESLRILNDFTALAMSLPALRADELVQIGGEPPDPDRAKGLIGAGTGLGVSALLPGTDASGQRIWVPMAGEGGHVSLPPTNEDEVRLLAVLWQRHAHVSAERVLSGSGLVLLYEAHAELAREAVQPLTPAEVARRGQSGDCPLCEAALRSFCLFMGTISANLAVTVGAQGGLYIGGGIVPKLGDFFLRSGFRERFDAKGRYGGYMQRIPVYVIHADYPALIGASRA